MNELVWFRITEVNHEFGKFHTLVEREVKLPKFLGIFPRRAWVLDKVCKDKKEAAEFVESKKGCIQ